MDPRAARAARWTLPLVLLVTAAAWVLLVVALAQGWLGPDVDRGSNFCEASRPGLLRQPVSALSNLAFSVAAIAIGWRARRGSAMGALAPAYGVLVALLGPGSAAMHGSETELGGDLDTLSMYLIAAFVAGYALTRRRGWSAGTFAAVFVALVVACELVDLLGPVPVVHTGGNAAFGLLLLLGLAVEWRQAAHEGRPRRWGLLAAGTLTLAFAIWTQAQDGSPWCRPESLLQGHGLWHALCALSAWLLYRYYDWSGGPGDPE